MKKHFMLLVVAGLISVTIASCGGEEKKETESTNNEGILLRLTPQEGSVMESVVDMDITMNGDVGMSTSLAMEFNMKVDNVDAEGVITVTSEYTQMKMNMDMMGQVIRYNSDDINPTDPVSQKMAEAMGGIINTPFDMKMNDLSEIVEAPDFSKMIGNNPMMAGQADQMKQTFDNMFAIYPERPVNLGESWDRTTVSGNSQMPMTLNATYTLKEILDEKVILTIGGSVESDGGIADVKGTFTGALDIDRATGFPIKSFMTQRISMSVQGMEVEMIMEMIMDTKVK